MKELRLLPISNRNRELKNSRNFHIGSIQNVQHLLVMIDHCHVEQYIEYLGIGVEARLSMHPGLERLKVMRFMKKVPAPKCHRSISSFLCLLGTCFLSSSFPNPTTSNYSRPGCINTLASTSAFEYFLHSKVYHDLQVLHFLGDTLLNQSV